MITDIKHIAGDLYQVIYEVQDKPNAYGNTKGTIEVNIRKAFEMDGKKVVVIFKDNEPIKKVYITPKDLENVEKGKKVLVDFMPAQRPRSTEEAYFVNPNEFYFPNPANQELRGRVFKLKEDKPQA